MIRKESRGSEGYIVTSSNTQFIEKWNNLFGSEGDVVNYEVLTSACFNGYIRDSRLRAIIWRLLLGVLPPNRAEWAQTLLESRRRYDQLKARFFSNPRSDNCSSWDISLMHPLSLEDESPWKRMFEEKELFQLINRDVIRTFPEIAFFQSETMRIMLSNILFVYASLNPKLSYKQGMHEVLAPIIYTICSDSEIYIQLRQLNLLGEMVESDLRLLDTVNDARYVEHDAYSIFEHLFALLEQWYEPNENCEKEEQKIDDLLQRISCAKRTENYRKALEETIPFSSFPFVPHAIFENEETQTKLHQRLRLIHYDILWKVDPLICKSIEHLEIQPQMFGIRWLRLLFGREFSLNNLMCLWDALFASNDGQNLVLVDYVYVALLINKRQTFALAFKIVSVVEGDYAECLKMVVRYPEVDDADRILKLALSLKWPSHFTMPAEFWPALPTKRNSVDQMAKQILTAETKSASVLAPSSYLWRNSSTAISTSTSDLANQAMTSSTLSIPSTIDSVSSKETKSSFLSKLTERFSFRRDSNISYLPESQSTFYDENDYNEFTIETSNPSGSTGAQLTRPGTAAKIEDMLSEMQVSALLTEQISSLQLRVNDFDAVARSSTQRLNACMGNVSRAFSDLIHEVQEIELENAVGAESDSMVTSHVNNENSQRKSSQIQQNSSIIHEASMSCSVSEVKDIVNGIEMVQLERQISSADDCSTPLLSEQGSSSKNRGVQKLQTKIERHHATIIEELRATIGELSTVQTSKSSLSPTKKSSSSDSKSSASIASDKASTMGLRLLMTDGESIPVATEALVDDKARFQQKVSPLSENKKKNSLQNEKNFVRQVEKSSQRHRRVNDVGRVEEFQPVAGRFLSTTNDLLSTRLSKSAMMRGRSASERKTSNTINSANTPALSAIMNRRSFWRHGDRSPSPNGPPRELHVIARRSTANIFGGGSGDTERIAEALEDLASDQIQMRSRAATMSRIAAQRADNDVGGRIDRRRFF